MLKSILKFGFREDKQMNKKLICQLLSTLFYFEILGFYYRFSSVKIYIYSKDD